MREEGAVSCDVVLATPAHSSHIDLTFPTESGSDSISESTTAVVAAVTSGTCPRT